MCTSEHSRVEVHDKYIVYYYNRGGEIFRVTYSRAKILLFKFEQNSCVSKMLYIDVWYFHILYTYINKFS